MAIAQKTSGAWQIGDHWVEVGPGQVTAYDDSLPVVAAPEYTPPSDWFDNPIMTGDQRTLGGTTWESLVDINVWTPPVAWREVVAEGYPTWVQPTGAHDAYALGFRVTHNGQNWENTGSASNVWDPGVFGWVAV